MLFEVAGPYRGDADAHGHAKHIRNYARNRKLHLIRRYYVSSYPPDHARSSLEGEKLRFIASKQDPLPFPSAEVIAHIAVLPLRQSNPSLSPKTACNCFYPLAWILFYLPNFFVSTGKVFLNLVALTRFVLHNSQEPMARWRVLASIMCSAIAYYLYYR